MRRPATRSLLALLLALVQGAHLPHAPEPAAGTPRATAADTALHAAAQDAADEDDRCALCLLLVAGAVPASSRAVPSPSDDGTSSIGPALASARASDARTLPPTRAPPTPA